MRKGLHYHFSLQTNANQLGVGGWKRDLANCVELLTGGEINGHRPHKTTAPPILLLLCGVSIQLKQFPLCAHMHVCIFMYGHM